MSNKKQHKIIANVSELTRRQIDELTEATGITTTAQLVSMAIDRMHREVCGVPEPVNPRSYTAFVEMCEFLEITPSRELLEKWIESGEVIAAAVERANT